LAGKNQAQRGADIACCLAPGDERWPTHWRFADRALPNWSFADGHLADVSLFVHGHGLPMRQIRSGGGSRHGKRRASYD